MPGCWGFANSGVVVNGGEALVVFNYDGWAPVHRKRTYEGELRIQVGDASPRPRRP